MIRGVNVHMGDAGITLALGDIPKGQWIRDDGIWHEAAWSKGKPLNMAAARERLVWFADYGGPIILNVTPIPWPGSDGWKTTNEWGYVAESDIPAIAASVADFVTQCRAIAREFGISDSRLHFQIGNEPGSGHPGGFFGPNGTPALRRGEWWERHGRLLLAIFKAVRVGRGKLILPSASFLDEQCAPVEIETMTPILKALAKYADFGAVHSRTYAPWLSPVAYAAEFARNLDARAELVAGITGLPIIGTEVYVHDIDTPDKPAAIRAILAKPPKTDGMLYKIGPGEFSIPRETLYPVGTAEEPG